MLWSTRNITRTASAALAALFFATACGTSSDASFTAPGDAPAAYSSAEILAGIDPVIRPNDSEVPPGHRFLFTNDVDGEVTLDVSLQTDEIAPLPEDGPSSELADGTRVVTVDESADPDRVSFILFDLADGNRVAVASRVYAPQKLITLIDGVEFPSEASITDVDGHTLVTAIPQPATVDGYLTEYDLAGGALVTIEVHTMLADEYPSWDFAATDRTTVLDGTDAVIARPERTGTLTFAFRYPETDYFVRATTFSASDDTGSGPVVDEDDLRTIIDAIELREPAA